MTARWSPARERERREALLARAARAHPRRPAWFVCADPDLAHALEQALAARGGGFARFGSLDDLAGALEARLGLPLARSADAPARIRIVEAALAQREVAIAGHGAAGTYRAAARLLPVIDRLRAHGWDGRTVPNDLPPLAPAAAALVAAHVELLGDLVAELDATLVAAARLDPAARLRRCARALRAARVPCPDRVALEGFWRLAPVERDLLEALASQGAEVDVAPWVALGPRGDEPPADPDPDPAETLLAALDRDGAATRGDDGSVVLLTAADPHEESRLTAAWIAERCAHGSHPNDHAVRVDPADGGADRMRRALAAHGIPSRGAGAVATRDTVPWQVFCAAVRLGWRGVDVFDLATVLSAPGAGVWGRHRDRLVATLRREVPGDWHAVRAILDAFVDPPPAGPDEEALVQRDHQESVRRRVSELVDLWSWHGPLRRHLPGDRPAALVVIVRDALERFLNPVRHLGSLDDPRSQALWVAAVAQVAAAARDVLARTAERGAALPETPGAWLAEVEALLGTVTDGDPGLRGDGVEILTSPWPLGPRPKVLVVHGFTRDRWPAPPPDPLVLGPLERAWLATAGPDLAALPDEGALRDDARRALWQTLAVATERLVLVAPRRGVAGDEALPSLAWDELIARCPPDRRPPPPSPLDRWVPNDLPTEVRAPRRRRDLAFAALGAGRVSEAVAACAPVAAGSWAVRDAARARFGPALDFDLGGLAAPALDAAVFTPRSLETLLKCRYAFLAETLLGLHPLRLARRPALGSGERLRVATAAVRGLDAVGDPERALDLAVKSEVPWALAPGHEVALAELRRAVGRFLTRFAAVRDALALGEALPPPDAAAADTLTLPGGRAIQVTRGALATRHHAVVELTAGSTRRLPALRAAGLDVAAALAPMDDRAAVLRLSLTRPEGDLVARRDRASDRAPDDAALARDDGLREHRDRVLAAVAQELDALHEPDARYAPHDQARARALDQLAARDCPKCPMALACRFRLEAP